MHETQEKLLKEIEKNPYISIRAMMKLVGVTSNRTIQHHINQLVKANKLRIQPFKYILKKDKKDA